MTGEKKKEKGSCGYIIHEDKFCGRELYDDEYCIFHSEDIEGKKADFKDAFRKEFERQKAQEEKYDFKGFVFPGDISFEEIEFEKDVSFCAAQFSGRADFPDAQFSGGAYFLETQFSGEAYFFNAQFSKEVDFGGAQFSGEANFHATEFSGDAYFWDVHFSGVAFFGYAQFSGVAEFLFSKFLGKELVGLFEVLRNKGVIIIFRGKYKIKDFRFHLSEPIARVYPVIDRMTKDAWYLDDFKNNHPFIHALWNVMAKCGQSIGRWALWSLFFALYFALNFYLINYAFPHAFSFDPAIQVNSVWSFIYYSVVTFTTLGFGDIIPTLAWVQRWVMAEVIMGYIMLGGLISILANKLARRS